MHPLILIFHVSPKNIVGCFLNQKVVYLAEKTNITAKLNHQHYPFLFLMPLKLESTFNDVLSTCSVFLVMYVYKEQLFHKERGIQTLKYTQKPAIK